MLRRPWVIVALGLALGSAPRAASAGPSPDPDALDHGDFWSFVVAPHADQIEALVEQARGRLALARDTRVLTRVGRMRAVSLREAAALTERIRSLDPHAPVLDYLRGMLALENGRVAAAEVALTAYVTGAPPSPLRTHALVRLGLIALTRHDGARAIPPLRQAVADPSARADHNEAVVLLATALDQAGDLDRGIALLEGSIDRGLGLTDGDDAVLWLALMTAYDRDEQVSAALELVELLQRMLEGEYLSRMWAALHQRTSSPMADLWYQRALLLETGGAPTEARAAWATYLGLGPEVRYRARAQAHLDALDLQLAAARAPVVGARPPRTGRP